MPLDKVVTRRQHTYQFLSRLNNHSSIRRSWSVQNNDEMGEREEENGELKIWKSMKFKNWKREACERERERRKGDYIQEEPDYPLANKNYGIRVTDWILLFLFLLNFGFFLQIFSSLLVRPVRKLSKMYRILKWFVLNGMPSYLCLLCDRAGLSRWAEKMTGKYLLHWIGLL